MNAELDPEQAALMRLAEARWLRQCAERLRRQTALKAASTPDTDRPAERNPR